MEKIKHYLNTLTPVKWCILVFSSLIIGLSFLKSFHYIKSYSNCDQRARLVGARAMQLNKDPYFYKWQQEDGAYLLDPNDQESRIVNGVTTTPTTLALISPINKLPYNKYKYFWGIFSFVCVFCIALFTLKKAKIVLQNIYFILPILALFFSSSIWFIHMERGQIYILYTFILSAIYYFATEKQKIFQYIAGALLALAIFIRPTFIFIIIPILFFKHYKVLISFLISLPLITIMQYKLWPIWQSYALAMSYYNGEKNMDNDAYIRPQMPENIEGFETLSKIKADFYSGGIEPFFNKLQQFHIPYLGYISLAIVGLVLILCCLKWKQKTSYKITTEPVFGLILFVSYILPEILMAAPRGAYNLVVYIFPLLLLATQNIPKPILALLLIGWLFVQSIPFYFNINYPLGEAFLLIGICWFISKNLHTKTAQSVSFL